MLEALLALAVSQLLLALLPSKIAWLLVTLAFFGALATREIISLSIIVWSIACWPLVLVILLLPPSKLPLPAAAWFEIGELYLAFLFIPPVTHGIKMFLYRSLCKQ